MTDVHCHVSCGDAAIRELLIGRDFVGVHPWEAGGPDLELSNGPESSAFVRCPLSSVLPSGREEGQRTKDIGQRQRTLDEDHGLWTKGDGLNALRLRLAADPTIGVGEIGLDRLKERTVSPQMRAVFVAQLALAAEFRRPVVLHGAKCWGQVVAEIKKYSGDIPSFLFHGFSRSDGLLPDIVALNGFVSVGPAVLNDHAVNYRELVKKIPLDRLVVETDRTLENAAMCPSVVEVAKKVAKLRGLSLEELERVTDANAARFTGMGQV